MKFIFLQKELFNGNGYKIVLNAGFRVRAHRHRRIQKKKI